MADKEVLKEAQEILGDKKIGSKRGAKDQARKDIGAYVDASDQIEDEEQEAGANGKLQDEEEYDDKEQQKQEARASEIDKEAEAQIQEDDKVVEQIEAENAEVADKENEQLQANAVDDEDEAALQKELKDGDASKGPAAKKAKTGVAVGDKIFDFELETDESTKDKPVTLAIKDVIKSKGAILFFYPKANTPGCTSQAAGFSEDLGSYEAKGYTVLGISADSPADQKSWKDKQGYKETFLCDQDHEVLKKLGVSNGKSINRSHIIVAKGGKIEDVRIGVSPQDSLKYAKELLLDN